MIFRAKGNCFITHVLYATFALSLLASCEQMLVSKYGDGGLISDKPCSAPCFLGIIPGETTKGQAIETIKKQGFAEYHEYPESGRLVGFSNFIYFEYDANQHLSSIKFVLTINIKVRDVIDKYGEPSRASVIYDASSTPEHNYFDMAIYYDKISAYLILPTQENWPAYVISEDTLVNQVRYFDEAAYKNAISTDQHITEWKGFGPYQDPVP